MSVFFGSLLGAAAGGILNYGSTIARSLGGAKGIFRTVVDKVGERLIPHISKKLGMDEGMLSGYYQKGANYLAEKGQQWIGRTKFGQAMADVGRMPDTIARDTNIRVPAGGSIGEGFKYGFKGTMDNVMGRDQQQQNADRAADVGYQSGVTKDNNAGDAQMN